MKRIVVGVDGSGGADRALRWAGDLAAEQGSEIVAVYALGTWEGIGRGAVNAVSAGLGVPHEQGSWRDQLCRKVEQDWCRPLREAGVPFRAHVEEGPPSAALVAVADREHADLVVVGAHGHGSVEDRVLGSVSYKVSHRAHQPVVIVPPDLR